MFFNEFLPLFLKEIGGGNSGQSSRVKGHFWQSQKAKIRGKKWRLKNYSLQFCLRF